MFVFLYIFTLSGQIKSLKKMTVLYNYTTLYIYGFGVSFSIKSQYVLSLKILSALCDLSVLSVQFVARASLLNYLTCYVTCLSILSGLTLATCRDLYQYISHLQHKKFSNARFLSDLVRHFFSDSIYRLSCRTRNITNFVCILRPAGENTWNLNITHNTQIIILIMSALLVELLCCMKNDIKRIINLIICNHLNFNLFSSLILSFLYTLKIVCNSY